MKKWLIFILVTAIISGLATFVGNAAERVLPIEPGSVAVNIVTVTILAFFLGLYIFFKSGAKTAAKCVAISLIAGSLAAIIASIFVEHSMAGAIGYGVAFGSVSSYFFESKSNDA